MIESDRLVTARSHTDEDDKNKGKKDADEMLHKFEKQLTELIAHKEKEIMEV